MRKEGLATALAAATARFPVYIYWEMMGDDQTGFKIIKTIHLVPVPKLPPPPGQKPAAAEAAVEA